MSSWNVSLKDMRSCGVRTFHYNEVVTGLAGIDCDFDIDSYIEVDVEDDVDILTILESCGLDAALWACGWVGGKDRDLRLFAVWCAREMSSVLSEADLELIRTAERYANGLIDVSELEAARRSGDSHIAITATATTGYDAAVFTACQTKCLVSDANLDISIDDVIEKQTDMFKKMLMGMAPWQVDRLIS